MIRLTEKNGKEARKMKKAVKRKMGRGLTSLYVLTLMATISAMTGTVSSANNWRDTTFSFKYNGDGSDVATVARAKTDKSKSYVKCNSSNVVATNVMGTAKNGLKAGQDGDPFDYDYNTAVYQVKPGKYRYFTNASKKYGATYLCLSTVDHKAHSIKGQWSPDNCSGK